MYTCSNLQTFNHVNYLTHTFKLYICTPLILLTMATLSFDNHLPECGNCKVKHVGEVSCIFKLLSFFVIHLLE